MDLNALVDEEIRERIRAAAKKLRTLADELEGRRTQSPKAQSSGPRKSGGKYFPDPNRRQCSCGTTIRKDSPHDACPLCRGSASSAAGRSSQNGAGANATGATK